jgi:hypothetical protein
VGDIAGAVENAAQRLGTSGSADAVGDYPAHLLGAAGAAMAAVEDADCASRNKGAGEDIDSKQGKGGKVKRGDETNDDENAAVRSGDTLLAIDGVPVADDGTIRFRGDQRLMFAHLVTTEGAHRDCCRCCCCCCGCRCCCPFLIIPS